MTRECSAFGMRAELRKIIPLSNTILPSYTVETFCLPGLVQNQFIGSLACLGLARARASSRDLDFNEGRRPPACEKPYELLRT